MILRQVLESLNRIFLYDFLADNNIIRKLNQVRKCVYDICVVLHASQFETICSKVTRRWHLEEDEKSHMEIWPKTAL